MAEPSSPAEEPTGDGRPVVDQPTERPAEPETEMLAPPTEDELSATGEPTLEEIRAAAAGDTGDDETEATPAAAGDRVDDETEATPAAATAVLPAEPAAPAPATAVRAPEGVEAEESAPAATVVQPAAAPPPAPPQQPVLAPAAESAPPAPHARGNRLVGVAWVLLAAGLFEALFFGVNALVVLAFGSPEAVVPQLQQIAATPLAWLPVLLFFLLYLLTVLLLNRAGRVAYVLASLIVGIVVYVASVLLFLLIERHTLGDSNTLAQTFLNWEFIVIGLVAREVMLWTGLAVGSRGIRVRRRNREARERYDRELADARA